MAHGAGSPPPVPGDGDLDRAMQEALASVERRVTPTPPAPPPAAAAADAAPAPGDEALREQLLRMAADFDNHRKRARREQDDARRFGSERLLTEMLPVLDNLDRAIAHGQGDQGAVMQGVRMVAKQFHDVLAAHGARPFVSVGQPFDPSRHEAVGQQASADAAAGTVLREMQRGYLLHERLLRPAQVVVATAPAAPLDPPAH